MGCTKDWGCIIAMTTADRGQIRPFWSRWCLYLSPVRDFVFAMVSYAFYKAFREIFEHILYKSFNNRRIDLSTIFIDALISKPVQSKKVPEEAGRKNGGGKGEVGQEAHYDDKDNDRPD